MLDPAVVEALRYPLLALAVLANLLSALLIAVSWQSLPAEIPAHFGITGRPDRWGGRWNLFLLLGIQTALNIVMSFQGSEEPLLMWIQCMTSLLLAFVVWSTIRVARREADRINTLILFGLLALMIVPAMTRAFWGR